MLVLAVVLPLVLVVTVVAGVILVRRSGDDPAGPTQGSTIEADRQLKAVLQETFDEAYEPAEDVDWFKERWWTDDHLVRTMPGKVVAYDLASDKVAWQLDVPDTHYCRATKQPSSKGYVAVLQGTKEDGCRRITVVDIRSGKKVWTKDVPPATPGRGEKALVTDFPRFDHRPVILGDRLYVPTDKGAHIMKITDGAVIETPNPKSECFTTHYDVIGETGVAYRNCARFGDEGRHLTAFDAQGKVLWKWNLPEENGKQFLPVGVLSVDPLIIRVFGKDNKRQIWRVDPKGRDGAGSHKVLVDITRQKLRDIVASDPCEMASGDGLYDCSAHLVSDGVLYLQHPQGEQPVDHARGLAAYDIESGKEKWQVVWKPGHDVTAPLGIGRDGRPIVYLLPSRRNPTPALLSVEPKNGAMSPIATLPPPDKAMARLGEPTITEQPKPEAIDWHNGYLAFFRLDARASDAGYGATIVYR